MKIKQILYRKITGQDICWLLTFGKHWFKYYPEEKIYVRCRLCGCKPKSCWFTLVRLNKKKAIEIANGK